MSGEGIDGGGFGGNTVKRDCDGDVNAVGDGGGTRDWDWRFSVAFDGGGDECVWDLDY